MLQQLDSRTGTFQLGFSFGQLDDTGFATRSVGTADLFVVLPARWKIPAGMLVSLEDLAGLPYISGFDSTPAGQVCSRLFVEAGVQPRVVARIHTHHLAGRLVQREMGYAILDSVTVRALLHERNSDAVVVCRLEGEPTLPVTAVYRGQRSPGKPTRLFVKCFEQACEALADTVEERLPQSIHV
jgi:DNA-binding transcriptional LysR family regulator